MNGKILARNYYIFLDWLMAGLAWTGLFIYRKSVIETELLGFRNPLAWDNNLLWGLLVVPIFWLILYGLGGMYLNVYRKNRLKEWIRTFNASLLGVTILFFALLLDDVVPDYRAYYEVFLIYFILHFSLTFFTRFWITHRIKTGIKNKKIGFNTLLIGESSRAMKIYQDLGREDNPEGYFFRGFLSLQPHDKGLLEGHLPWLGPVELIQKVVLEKNIEEVIIAIESSQHSQLQEILNRLEGHHVTIRLVPDMYDIMSGSVRMSELFGSPLIEIRQVFIPEWQRIAKRWIDVIVSSLVLLMGSPIYICIAFFIKIQSKGPIIYSQERVGQYGIPFTIYKFRTMKTDAEKGIPKLSGNHDDRRTKVGIVLRKYRLDELPQFWNVLKGDMSLVGPRPERQFFIDQIIKEAPEYKHLLKIRPGITSWGQVKYGYAENIQQMVERMKYDLLYLENMNMTMDIRIIIHTVMVVIKGRGK